MHIHTSDQEILHLGFGGYTCNWGVHIAGLYESEEERDEILFGYLHQGDLAGDQQLYCPVEQTFEQFIGKYERQYPECRGHVHDSRHFRLSGAREMYYPDGTFSPFAMDEGLNTFYRQSMAERKRNIRATAEMSWALEAIPGIDQLMVYESRLNYFIPGKPWISICLYNLNLFSGDQVMKVLQTHPYTISGGVILQNPFFQDPDSWLKKNAPDFLPKSGTIS